VKVLLANPNATERLTKACGDLARAVALPGTEIVEWTNRDGPAVIDSQDTDAAARGPLVAGLAGLAPRPDAVVLAGFGDYGTRTVKATLPVPVVGLAEAALGYAVTLGERVAIVTTTPRMIAYTERLVETLGFAARCRAVRAVDLPPIAAGEPPADALVPEIAAAATATGADVVVLGGSRLSPYAAPLRARLDVPVVEPVACAVTLAESLVRLGACRRA
jgi:allantoin racemase